MTEATAGAAAAATAPEQGQQQQQQQQAKEQKKGPSLQDLYLQVRDKPCRVVDVRVESLGPEIEGPGGLTQSPKPLRLKQEILDRELDRVYEAKTLREVHEALERSVEVLRQLEVFDDITALIDSQPLDEPDSCSVQMVLQEVGRYKFGGGTYTQGGEYSVEGNMVARNVLGVADQWAVTGEIGTRSSKNFAASFRLPRARGTGVTPELRLLQTFANQQLHSSWSEATRGLSLGVVSADNPGMSLAYEYGWRVLSTDAHASRSVINQRGDYLKAALRCSCSFEGGGRNSSEVLPTEGWQLRLTNEIGGLAPGAARLRYVRQQLHGSWATALAEGLSLHIEGSTGLLLPCWAPSSCSSSKASSLPERFYLGGVESNLRGFDTRGVGPSEPRRIATAAAGSRSSSAGSGGSDAAAAAAAGGGEPITRDALGGDVFGSVYAALMMRLPGKAGDLGVHAHLFANGGSSALLQQAGGSSSGSSAGGGAAADHGAGFGGLLGGIGEKLRSSGRELGATFRWSAGVGLVFPTQLGRLEANYCWVLTSQEHDRLRRGFSFGFAANMGL
uniref:Bacterial surface antigen (D15) domain-containing protein n=1 Tax=Tetradesmus obliquus TaxID=3088 RepID=A0A383WJ48_TETOB|eukprot:jgi/Sobl393_1/12257/SZX77495.1